MQLGGGWQQRCHAAFILFRGASLPVRYDGLQTVSDCSSKFMTTLSTPLCLGSRLDVCRRAASTPRGYQEQVPHVSTDAETQPATVRLCSALRERLGGVSMIRTSMTASAGSVRTSLIPSCADLSGCHCPEDMSVGIQGIIY